MTSYKIHFLIVKSVVGKDMIQCHLKESEIVKGFKWFVIWDKKCIEKTMTWCVLASKKKRECFFVICQCDKLCVCWAVAQASTFRPSNVAPIILTNSVWYVRKTQKYIFFNVEETIVSSFFNLKFGRGY